MTQVPLSPVWHEAEALYGFTARQFSLVKRYWAWEVLWFFYSLVSVLSIGYLASGLGLAVLSGREFHRTQLFLLVGSLLWGYLSSVFTDVSFAISWERWEGTIEYTFMAPVRRVTHLLGICLFAIVYGLIRSAIVLAIAVPLFNLDLSQSDLLAAAAVLAASTLPLVGIGILAAVLPLLSPEKGDQMAMAIQGFLLLVSGVYYPLSVLPWPLQVAGYFSPLTYTLSGIRDSLLQGRHLVDLLPLLGLLLAMGVVLIPAGLAVFGWAERRAKHLGLLKRNG
ncbi:MAG: ABC transporter permease [Candidatus Dormibacteraeota bacterium]|nr:ABC transporter permease [Candidatus Dormibacteraeota bacterium]